MLKAYVLLVFYAKSFSHKLFKYLVLFYSMYTSNYIIEYINIALYETIAH